MKLKYIRNISEPTATYVRSDFISHIENKENINVIVEAGARDLLDTLQLEKIYPNAKILSFECNPECIEICKNNLNFSQGRITFFDCALSNENKILDFYSFDSEKCIEHDPGCSSLYEHKNTSNVPMKKIQVTARTLKSVLEELKLTKVDMLCLDLQGGEYNALLGLQEYIDSVKYLIVEFDSDYYKNAPNKNILINFLKNNNFVPIYSHSDTLFKRFTSFITGEKFQELADISIALNTENNFASNLVKTQLNNTKTKCYVFDNSNEIKNIPDEIKNAKSIFVYTHILPFFFQKIFPSIKSTFTLITHNSDNGIEANMLTYLDDVRINKWFCQNKYISHPKLFSLPIAIANSQWPHGNLSILKEVMLTNLQKNNLVYKNFDISTNPDHRQQANYDTNLNGFSMSPNTIFSDYLKQIKQSYFSFAPLGNGADCHRIWECLYLGCVPIVPKREYCFDDFKHLPILFVENFKNVTKEYLEQQIDIFYPLSKYNLEMLDLEYWKIKINE